MVSKLLIAVDGSAHSRMAVSLGSKIAAALHADVILLHVVWKEKVPKAMVDFASTEQIRGTDIDRLMNAAQKYFDHEAEIARKAGVKNVSVQVERGPIARTIIATTKQTGADMIVLGSRGLGDMEGLLRGGVSHRVEILAKCPVLVVK